MMSAVRRRPVPPLEPGWVIVDGLPVFHRAFRPADPASTIVHVHGFGISGTYLEPTAALLAHRHDTFVPDLPGMGRSIRPDVPLDLPGLARAVVSYCDAVGVERATFVGNSLGCPIILELAAAYPERIARAVLVSPAGGPNNRPLRRAVRQMAVDGLREPPAMAVIATRDYLRFGVLQSLSLFKAMTRYPTLERLPQLTVPTLVIIGARDPFVRIDRAHVLAAVPHVVAVKIAGAHALNFTAPELIAELIEAHLADVPLTADHGPRRDVEIVMIGPAG
jgi:pimeloyl-ACP methyl ester carboxylesterase